MTKPGDHLRLPSVRWNCTPLEQVSSTSMRSASSAIHFPGTSAQWITIAVTPYPLTFRVRVGLHVTRVVICSYRLVRESFFLHSRRECSRSYCIRDVWPPRRLWSSHVEQLAGISTSFLSCCFRFNCNLSQGMCPCRVRPRTPRSSYSVTVSLDMGSRSPMHWR